MKKVLVLVFMIAFMQHAHTENHSAAYAAEFSQHKNQSHYAQPWKVHEIAKDFELLDVWEFPIAADRSKGQDFLFFLKMMRQPPPEKNRRSASLKFLAAQVLVYLRMQMGEVFGLDKNINTLPIPGCRETSVKDRLSKKDREQSLSLLELGISDYDNSTWQIVYFYKEELLMELSIDPAHALMHFGWVHKSDHIYTAQLAVYAKPRGDFGKFYLQLIMPFRRLIIYPVFMEAVKNIWEEFNR
jgi:hypothetical protein